MPNQLKDDPELLGIMQIAQLSARDVYQTSVAWKHFSELTVSFLQKNGLLDIRSRTDCGPLQGFGGSDPSPRHYPLLSITNTPGMLQDYADAMIKTLDLFHHQPEYPGLPFGLSVLDLCDMAFRFASLYGRTNGAVPIEDLDFSMSGTPAFAFEVNGKPYTINALHYYYRYAYCCRHIDFSKVDTVVEIGGGSGRFAEVLKTAHPHLTFYLLEITPQNYICHQYLKAVLGEDAVVDYRLLVNSKSIQIPDGKIAVLGNWQVEHIKPQGRVLFVNTASIQEMEPPIVKNYLDFVKPYAQAMYLMQSVTGVDHHSGNPLQGGFAANPVTMNQYEEYLDSFELVSLELAYDAFKPIKDLAKNYFNMIWINKENCQISRLPR
jgi:putative sugar O-methyltransferase